MKINPTCSACGHDSRSFCHRVKKLGEHIRVRPTGVTVTPRKHSCPLGYHLLVP